MAYSAGYVVERIKASDLNADFAWVGMIGAYKTANESRTSTTTLADDSQLVIPGVANAVYSGWTFVGYTGDVTGDIKYRFTFPSSDFLWSPMRAPTTAVSFSATTPDWGGETVTATTNTSTITGGATAGIGALWSSFTWMVGATGGNLTFQWAQNTSSGTALTCLKGSNIMMWRMA